MFFGRQAQLEQLNRLLHKQVGSFVTCRGRRRVGKSTLIERFAAECGAKFIKLEGVQPKAKYGNADKLRAFAEQLAAQTGAESTVPANWLNAFIRLDREIKDEDRWTVALLDEIAWFGYYDPKAPFAWRKSSARRKSPRMSSAKLTKRSGRSRNAKACPFERRWFMTAN